MWLCICILCTVSLLVLYYITRTRKSYEQRLLGVMRVSDYSINFAVRLNAPDAVAWFAFGSRTPKISFCGKPSSPHPFSLIGRSHPEDRESVIAAKWRGIQLQTPAEIFCRLCTIEQGFRWVKISVQPWFRSARLQGWTGEMWDVTELVESQCLLNLQGSLVDTFFDVHFEVNCELEVLNENSKLRKFLNAPHKVAGANIKEFIVGPEWDAIFQSAVGRLQSAPCTVAKADGGRKARVFVARPKSVLVSGCAGYVGLKLERSESSESSEGPDGEEVLGKLKAVWDVSGGRSVLATIATDTKLARHVDKVDWTEVFRILDAKKINIFAPDNQIIEGKVARAQMEVLCDMAVRDAGESGVNLLVQAIEFCDRVIQDDLSTKSMLVAYYLATVMKQEYPDLGVARKMFYNYSAVASQSISAGKCGRVVALENLATVTWCWAQLQRQTGRIDAALVTEASARQLRRETLPSFLVCL